METAALNHSLNPCFYGKTCEVRSQETGDTLTLSLPREHGCQYQQACGGSKVATGCAGRWGETLGLQ